MKGGDEKEGTKQLWFIEIIQCTRRRRWFHLKRYLIYSDLFVDQNDFKLINQFRSYGVSFERKMTSSSSSSSSPTSPSISFPSALIHSAKRGTKSPPPPPFSGSPFTESLRRGEKRSKEQKKGERETLLLITPEEERKRGGGGDRSSAAATANRLTQSRTRRASVERRTDGREIKPSKANLGLYSVE